MQCDVNCTAKVLKAIAHPLRLKLLCRLRDQELTVQELVSQSGASQSNVSQHLALLRHKGIVSTRRDASRIYYRIGDPKLLALIMMMQDIYCQKAA
ncbi:MAG: ArsR family transcriptional regulator [Gammaproteobacteria bacterium SG8_47]|nr:MAG: ArsR family transcriptional regulator [Gammaproteobacteria bacterium SG8_47]